MNRLKQTLNFLSLPIALGVCIALAALLFFPEQLNIDKSTLKQWSSSARSSDWQGPVSYSSAVNKASLAVVNIYTRKETKRRRHPLYDDPLYRRFFNIADVPKQKRMLATLGSGVIVSEQGYILTNYHVIEGADEIVVALQDGREAHAQLLGENIERDLAVLKINLDNLQPIPIDLSQPPRVGDVVLAIGNPFGVGQTVTQGIVSATNRNRKLQISDYENFIQTDAEIHPGNSGGALIDARGNLLGINTAALSEAGFTGGIAFSIPIDIAMQTLTDIVQFGRVVRGWLGVEGKSISPRLAQEAGLQFSNGVIVTRTTAGGPAQIAGLRTGDVIVGIGGNTIKDPRDIVQFIQESRPGDTVTIEYIRGGKLATLNVVLEEKPLTTG